jgi:hypothetical protein
MKECADCGLTLFFESAHPPFIAGLAYESSLHVLKILEKVRRRFASNQANLILDVDLLENPIRNKMFSAIGWILTELAFTCSHFSSLWPTLTNPNSKTITPMPRIFPRPVESAIRILKLICDDPQNPTDLRARAAELILHAYRLASLPADAEPRHRTVKQIASARVKISDLDRQLTGKIAEDRKQKKIERQIDALLKGKEQQ